MATLMYRLTAYGQPHKAGHRYVDLYRFFEHDDEEYLPRRRKFHPGWLRR